MSVVKSLVGAVRPSQLVPVAHAVVVAVELQSITAAWKKRGINTTMSGSRMNTRIPLRWSRDLRDADRLAFAPRILIPFLTGRGGIGVWITRVWPGRLL